MMLSSPRRLVQVAVGALLGAVLLLPAAGAAPNTEDQPSAVAEELAATVQRWIATGVIADPGRTGSSIEVSLPAMARVDLGLLVEPGNTTGEGLRVMGVRPGGWGQALGLQLDDRILGVGEAGRMSVVDGAVAATSVAALRAQLLALDRKSEIGVRVFRGGSEIELKGPSPVQQLPPVRLVVGESPGVLAPVDSERAQDVCGRIRVSPGPPLQRSLHEASIQSIDGTSPPSKSPSIRVEPGLRTIVVSERIPPAFLPGTTRRAREAGRTRELTLWVEAGRTYLIGARLLPAPTVRGPYWEPIVWRTLAEPCR
jgi:hypothetical protein